MLCNLWHLWKYIMVITSIKLCTFILVLMTLTLFLLRSLESWKTKWNFCFECELTEPFALVLMWCEKLGTKWTCSVFAIGGFRLYPLSLRHDEVDVKSLILVINSHQHLLRQKILLRNQLVNSCCVDILRIVMCAANGDYAMWMPGWLGNAAHLSLCAENYMEFVQ